jgi:hypothetical protein
LLAQRKSAVRKGSVEGESGLAAGRPRTRRTDYRAVEYASFLAGSSMRRKAKSTAAKMITINGNIRDRKRIDGICGRVWDRFRWQLDGLRDDDT